MDYKTADEKLPRIYALTKKVHRIELKKYLKNIYQVADEQKALAVLAHITNSRNLRYWGANFNTV